MFAPKVAKPQAKATADPTNSPTHQHQKPVAGRFGSDAVEQARMLPATIGNQATLRYLTQRLSNSPAKALGEHRPPEAAGTTGEARSRAWNFCNVPLFPPDRPRQTQPLGDRAAPPIVHQALSAAGRPLEPTLRHHMQDQFGAALDGIRIHTDDVAARAAESVNARAFSVGQHLVFGPNEFAPEGTAGRHLLAHEIAHALQQGAVFSSGPLRVSQPNEAGERQAESAAEAAIAGRPIGTLGPAAPNVVARQPKPTEKTKGEVTEDETGEDKYRGTHVSKIIISLARGRVGFQTPLGMILGNVDTDLKPGDYTLKPDLPTQKWIVNGPGVKSGLRFFVDLEGADPWTLAYPATLPLTVAAGSATEPKTFGDMQDPATGKLTDPLWVYEGMPLKKPIAGIDDFEDVRYDLDYRSDKGNLSKFLMLNYRDNSHKDVNIDSIYRDTPRLWAAKQEALKVMDDYNAVWILGSFPTVFFILTIQPLATGIEPEPPRYSAARRSVPNGAGAGRDESVPTERPVPGPEWPTAEPSEGGVGKDPSVQTAGPDTVPPGSVGAMRRLQYEASPKHGAVERITDKGVSNRAPAHGQDALDTSVQVKETSPRRVGIDYAEGEFVVFDETHSPGQASPQQTTGVYHGHVRTWEQLDQQMKNALIRSGMASRSGKIL